MALIRLLVLLAGVLSTLSAPAAESCQQAEVTLAARTATAHDLRLVCEAAADGLSFLRQIGLVPAAPVRIKVMDVLPAWQGVTPLGQFVPTRDEINVLSYASCLAACWRDPPFNVPMNEDIYRSFVVHEVAHALAHRQLAGRQVTRLHMEYLAYVSQLESMAAEVRDPIVQAAAVEGFGSAEEINDMVYAMDPNLFGVMSWLHYKRPGNGPGALRRMLGLD